jgi:hypothetical protein
MVSFVDMVLLEHQGPIMRFELDREAGCREAIAWCTTGKRRTTI